MSKHGYPGLVQVPPSDRWLLRRRLLRWGIVIITVTWGASAITAWLSPSDHNRDCQTALGPGASPDLQRQCGQPDQSVAATPSAPLQTESLVAEVSPKASPAEPRRSMSIPSPAPDRPATPSSTDHASRTTPSRPANDSVAPPKAPPAKPPSVPLPTKSLVAE